MAHRNETRSHWGKDEINLSYIGTKDDQIHEYEEPISVRSSDDDVYQTIKPSALTAQNVQNVQNAQNTRDADMRLESVVTRKTIILTVIGSLLLSTLISFITGFTVYHLTIAKVASDKQDQTINSGTESSNTMDVLALKVKLLESNVTTTADEMRSLEGSLSKLGNTLTTASDCSELYAAGTVEDGVYTISPDGHCPFHVYCDMTGGGWTLIQTRIDGSVNFHRTWQEYAHGFGNIDGEHWLGLDKIHRLTADGSEIYFHFEYYNGTTGFAHYQSFSVQGATAEYQMNVVDFGYNGTIEELFSYHNNMKFTTYDRDNDDWSDGNCASEFDGGAWWYHDCYHFGN